MKKTCGNCRYCTENNVCNGDCFCKAKKIEVSHDDDISYYGEVLDSPCLAYAERL